MTGKCLPTFICLYERLLQPGSSAMAEHGNRQALSLAPKLLMHDFHPPLPLSWKHCDDVCHPLQNIYLSCGSLFLLTTRNYIWGVDSHGQTCGKVSGIERNKLVISALCCQYFKYLLQYFILWVLILTGGIVVEKTVVFLIRIFIQHWSKKSQIWHVAGINLCSCCTGSLAFLHIHLF